MFIPFHSSQLIPLSGLSAPLWVYILIIMSYVPCSIIWTMAGTGTTTWSWTSIQPQESWTRHQWWWCCENGHHLLLLVVCDLGASAAFTNHRIVFTSLFGCACTWFLPLLEQKKDYWQYIAACWLHTLAVKARHANGTPTHRSADVWSCSAPPPRSSTVSLQPHRQGARFRCQKPVTRVKNRNTR